MERTVPKPFDQKFIAAAEALASTVIHLKLKSLDLLEDYEKETEDQMGKWTGKAACYGSNPDLFFGGPGVEDEASADEAEDAPTGAKTSVPKDESETKKRPKKQGVEQANIEAVKVCAGCPVRLPCLEYALVRGEKRDGVWGGTTSKMRTGLLNTGRLIIRKSWEKE